MRENRRIDEDIMNALEQYINEMENRRSAIENSTNNVDVWTQLQQKENDLVLAAELGKALLEKNEELKKQQDAIVEDYSKKLEVSTLLFFCYFVLKAKSSLK